MSEEKGCRKRFLDSGGIHWSQTPNRKTEKPLPKSSFFLLSKQVQLFKPVLLRLERSRLKTRTFQHQNNHRLFTFPDTADTEFIDFVRFYIGHTESFRTRAVYSRG